MTDTAGLNGRRILIVEDETMIAMLLEEMLADLGCIVIGPARDVAMALQMVGQAGPIDGAILDLNLRGERADPVADALTARRVPFIFATGYGEAGIDPRFKDAPVLQKPYEFAKLTRTLIETCGA